MGEQHHCHLMPLILILQQHSDVKMQNFDSTRTKSLAACCMLAAALSKLKAVNESLGNSQARLSSQQARLSISHSVHVEVAASGAQKSSCKNFDIHVDTT